MIYTSYFGNYKNFPEDSYVIGVARHPPPDVENWVNLAPSAELLQQYKSKKIDEFIFKLKYLSELRVLNRKEYRDYLHDLENRYKNIILCCYEKKEDFCHRHILAEWLDLNIKEL